MAGGINPFVYTHNNPINYTDRYGLFDDTITPAIAAAIGAGMIATYEGSKRALKWLINNWNESTENNDSEGCPNDSLDDYPADPDDWNSPDGWEETKAGEKTGGRNRQWRGPDGELRRWDREGREGGKERGPHWHDPRYPGGHITPNR